MRARLSDLIHWDGNSRRAIKQGRTGLEGLVFAILASNSITIGLAGSALAISAITGALSIGISVGLSFLSASLFKQQAPKPEDVQVTTKNPTAPRVRHYGRVKTSGSLAFLESKNGAIYKVIATGTGQLDAIEEYFVDDRTVTLDGSGWVIPAVMMIDRRHAPTASFRLT